MITVLLKNSSVLRIAILKTFLIMNFAFHANSQEMWGIANSNYAGVMGLHLNPASIVGVPYEYEVNILAGDFFYDNNYLTIPRLSDLRRTQAEDGSQTETVTVIEDNSSATKHAYASGLLLGPSYIRNKNTKAWAVHTALRAVVSANNIPPSLAQAFSTKFDYAPLHNVVFTDMKIQAAGMFFGDIGFSYAKVYLDRDPHWLALGATVKGIVAFDGFFAHADAGEYIIPDSNSLIMNHVNLEYGHAIPGNGGVLSIRGFGGGVDLGAVYIHKRNPAAYECGKNADRRKRYQFKTGLALIDLGYVMYNRDASHFMINDGTINWNYIDSTDINRIEDFDRELSAHSGSSLASNRFGIFLPAAASFQFDYCIKPKWYANLSVVQRLPLSKREVYRANSIALVPRYETRQFEASVSANMYEYEKVYLGAAVRYMFFVLGSDRLLSFIGNNVRSMDLFFGLKFNSCMLKKKTKNRGACPMG